MKIIKTIAGFLCFLILLSCEGYEIFEDELYEKIVYVLTKEDNNIFSEVHSLDEVTSIGYISVLVSGSNPVNESINVEFEFDQESLDEYNQKMFGVDKDLFLDPLHPSHYNIPSLQVPINPSDVPQRGLLQIHIKPEGLSPDSTYFIPLRIKNASVDNISEDNRTVMYQVYIKNQYADQKERTIYSMRGEKTEEDRPPYAILTNKTVLPLTKNKIRTTVDQRSFEAKKEVINTSCMVIEIKNNHALAITPFNRDYLEIEEIPLEGYNQYRADVAGNYRFYLSYRYRSRSDMDSEWSAWVTISENLLRYVDRSETE